MSVTFACTSTLGSAPDLFQAGEIGKQMGSQAGKQTRGLSRGEVELLCKGKSRIHWTKETKTI